MRNYNNNQLNIPLLSEAMNRFKTQAAQEAGVNLTHDYNAHMTILEADDLGGQTVTKMYPVRTEFSRNIRTTIGHVQSVSYIATIPIQNTRLANR